MSAPALCAPSCAFSGGVEVFAGCAGSQAAPLPPPIAQAPAHAPAAQASTSKGLGPQPAAGVAPESLAQLAGAWARSAADCNKLFQRRGSAVAYRQPVDQFAQAAIIESQRIRLPTSICRLERASHEGGALKVSGECQDSISYTSQTAYVKLRSKNEIVFNPNGDPALDTSMNAVPAVTVTMGLALATLAKSCRSSRCFSFSRCSPCSWCPARRRRGKAGRSGCRTSCKSFPRRISSASPRPSSTGRPASTLFGPSSS